MYFGPQNSTNKEFLRISLCTFTEIRGAFLGAQEASNDRHKHIRAHLSSDQRKKKRKATTDIKLDKNGKNTADIDEISLTRDPHLRAYHITSEHYGRNITVAFDSVDEPYVKIRHGRILQTNASGQYKENTREKRSLRCNSN